MQHPSPAPEYILEARNITKTYHTKHGDVQPLNDVSLHLSPGETVSLTGRSGCGKSTFLYIAGLLEPATGGSIFINGKDCSTLTESARTRMRRNYLGFIYQFHGLLSDFTAEENILAPFMITGKPTAQEKERATHLMQRLGIYERRNHMPKELSGGEQQRVAAARAIIKKPRVLLADEPTGNLDGASARIIMDTALQAARDDNTAFLCVTHNEALAAECKTRYRIDNGVLLPAKEAHAVH